MAPKAKARSAAKAAPAVHSSVVPVDRSIDERIAATGLPLQEAVQRGWEEGISRLEPTGEKWGKEKLGYLEDLLQEPDTLRQIIELTRGYGINKFEPLARGWESAVFDTDAGKVLKIGPQSRRFFSQRSWGPSEPYDYQLPTGVWGVLPNERTHIIGNARVSQDGTPFQHDWNIFLQDRVKHSGVDQQDVRFVENALNAQGYGWLDSSDSNLGLASSDPYRPVVFDGLVRKLDGAYNPDGTYTTSGGITLPGKKFVPPTTRPWVLAALATGAGGLASMSGGTARASEPTADDIANAKVVPAKKGNDPAMLDTVEEMARGMLPMQATKQLTPEESIRRFRKPSWTPPPPNGMERVVGDMSMAISPQEYHKWYTTPERGYGGPEHQRFMAAFNEAMDTPSIPAAAVGRKGDDLTMRQYFETLPMRVQMAALEKAARTKKPEDIAEFKRIFDINSQYGGDAIPTQRSDVPFVNPIAADAYAELTGQRYDRGSPWGKVGAELVLGALQSGTRGQQYAEDNTTSQSQADEWKAKYGEEADRMLPAGAEKNAMRQRVFELASTLSDNPQFAPTNYNSLDVAMNALGTMSGPVGETNSEPLPMDRPSFQRFNKLVDASAPRGRMQIRTDAWDAGRKQYGEKPYVVKQEAFQRWDPQSFMGIREQLGSPAFTPAGKVQAAYYPIFSDLAMQGGLGMTPEARDFVGQTYANQMRPSQIRPNDQTPQQARETEQWWDNYQGAKRDYWSPRIGPPLSAAMDATSRAFGNRGIRRSYLSPAMTDLVNLPSDTAESVYQTAAVALPVAGSMVGKTGKAAFRGALSTLADEPIENMYTTPLITGETSGYFTPQQSSPWLRTYAGRDVDPNDVDAHTKAIMEADNEFRRQNQQEFDKWRTSKARAPYSEAYQQ